MAGAIALIDGEHHPDAVRDALERVGEDVSVHAALFCGGEEKLAPGVLEDAAATYGLPVTVAEGDLGDALRELAVAHPEADRVIDLADEPILGARAKLALAASALDAGLRYVGADFELRPVERLRPDFDGPILAVIGTGKRTGKTAVAGHWARLLHEAGERPLIVSMGRGGPAEPQLAAPDTALPELLAIARGGRHAASDYLEDAALAGVPAVGYRRARRRPGGRDRAFQPRRRPRARDRPGARRAAGGGLGRRGAARRRGRHGHGGRLPRGRHGGTRARSGC